MYAIVEIAGQQFKVEEGKKIFVHRLEIEEGKKIEFDQVLLIEEEGKVTIGEPVIKDAKIQAKVLENVRGDKVIVFKKKRKKGYRIKNGHRQNFTQVEIISINGKVTKKAVVKKEKPEEAPVAEAAVEKKVEKKKAATKKPAEAAAVKAEKKAPASKTKTTKEKK